MIIGCPSCTTKFQVQDGAIGNGGRFVRCSVCSYEWVEAPKVSEVKKVESEVAKGNNIGNLQKEQLNAPNELILAEVEKETKKNQTEKNSLPSPKLSHKKSIWLFISKTSALVTMIIFAVLFSLNQHEKIISIIPELQILYDYGSLYKNNGLKLVNYKISPLLGENNIGFKEVDIVATIKNISKLSQKLNSIRFIIYDNNHRRLDNLEMVLNKIIDTEQTYEVNGRFSKLPENSAYIMIEIGNEIDLLIHDIDNLRVI